MARWEEELAELVVRRGGALVGYGYSLTRDKAQAEDLVQDALVKVYSRLRRPPSVVGQTQVDLDQPEPTNAEGYVRRAMLTIYLDGYRRRSHFAGFKHLLADDEHTPGADRVATARVDVGVALARLSPRQREVVALRYFEDMTIPQIATALGLNQGTVKRHLFDATAVLRQALAEVSVPAMDTDLDDRVGTVVGATRRRRVTKVAAVAGVSMVLAVVLALRRQRVLDLAPGGHLHQERGRVAGGGRCWCRQRGAGRRRSSRREVLGLAAQHPGPHAGGADLVDLLRRRRRVVLVRGRRARSGVHRGWAAPMRFRELPAHRHHRSRVPARQGG
ncbi:sigma-70 family RNA polymerase sigma factor [Promicromonospora sp. NPDC050262]|uniref:RNA polymerase sigma factor n=1 Tax=Promicromonospora sp. NPDC050262 TaxID=3155036 RepID=UPI0033D3855A